MLYDVFVVMCSYVMYYMLDDTHIHVYVCVYIYIYIYIAVCLLFLFTGTPVMDEARLRPPTSRRIVPRESIIIIIMMIIMITKITITITINNMCVCYY